MENTAELVFGVGEGDFKREVATIGKDFESTRAGRNGFRPPRPETRKSNVEGSPRRPKAQAAVVALER